MPKGRRCCSRREKEGCWIRKGQTAFHRSASDRPSFQSRDSRHSSRQALAPCLPEGHPEPSRRCACTVPEKRRGRVLFASTTGKQQSGSQGRLSRVCSIAPQII